MATRKKGTAKERERDEVLTACALGEKFMRTYGDDEQVRKAAMDVVNAGYWADVRSTAEDYLQRAEKGEFKSDEELRDDLNQHVDGNYWVIYTYWARVCVLCSNNSDAYEEEMGEAPKDDSQRAYFALMADISAHPDMEKAFAIARGDDE